MKQKLLAAVAASTLVFSFMQSAPIAKAQTYNSAYVTSITFQNLTASTANVTFTFYAENTATSAAVVNRTVAGNAASSLGVGSVSGISAGFKGSTVMASDQPVAATLVQVPPSASASKNRLLSSGFSNGSATVLIGTIQKNMFSAAINAVMSIQNTDSVANDITVAYYPVGSATALDTDTYLAVPAGAAVYADAGQDAELGASFNGSAIVTAVKSGTNNPGSAVATVLELDSTTGKTDGDAFEGVSSGSTTVYMPSALCQFSGQKLTSFYAVQNTSTSTSASVTATYFDLAGTVLSTQVLTPTANGKVSFNGCNGTNPVGMNGAATLVSTQPIIVIGKVKNDAVLGVQGISTAFLGVTQGYTKLALPYVRWANDANNTAASGKQRAFLTIQNVGANALTGDIVVKYYDLNGAISSTHTIAVVNMLPGQKVNSNPRLGLPNPTDPTFEFGYYGSAFGGSAVIEGPAGSLLGVVVRVQNPTVVGSNQAGEDYNGAPVP